MSGLNTLLPDWFWLVGDREEEEYMWLVVLKLSRLFLLESSEEFIIYTFCLKI